MFALFELAKLVNFSSETLKTEHVVSIRQLAWKEVGDRSFLALLFSNGYLLLRYATHGSPPVVRQLPWHPDRPIQSMTFDPSATWLLCVTAKDVLYIVPALALMDSRARIEQLWKLDDITRIKSKKRRGQPTCLAWWETFGGEHVAVVGTKLGYVLFVCLQTERVVAERDVNENVSNVEVLRDEANRVTHALITTKSNSQWKILLERKDRTQPSVDESDIAYMGFENINININILHHPENRTSEFQLKRVQQFSSSTSLTPVNIQGRPMVAARDLLTKQLQLVTKTEQQTVVCGSIEIYDSTIERAPLLTYLVPEAVQDVLVTDRLLYFTSMDERSRLEVVATKLDQAGPTSDEHFNTAAILQSFQLGPSENIVGIFKRSYPFYWHEKREEEKKHAGTSSKKAGYDDTGQADSPSTFQINSHTVLDGCVVVTTQNVYECRPRVSPEALFVDISVNRSNQTSAEKLAVSLGLDVNSLYCLVAQVYLSRHNYRQASRFFQLAKTPHLQRVGAFAQYGRMSEVVQYLRQTLDCKQHELRPAEMEGLSNMMVLAYVQQLLEDRGRTNELTYDLREFLKTNAHYSKKEAIDTLVDNGFYEIALTMAKVQHCLVDVLERVLGIGGGNRSLMEAALHNLPHDSVDQMVHSSLLQYLSPADLVHMLEDRHTTALEFMDHIETLLNDLDLDLLETVTKLFDVSLPPYRKLLKPSGQQGSPKSNNNDDISLTKSDNHQCALGDEQESDERLTKLTNFFARCVILLNKRRGKDIELSFSQDAFTPLDSKTDRPADPTLQYRLALRQRIVSAGRHHSALIHNNQLYMWGDCFHHERSGKEGEKTNKDLWRPYIPIGFQTILVKSVACGAQHSMAITDDGLYGWGDCRYGQLGIGQCYSDIVRKPRRVGGFGDALCVDVTCGNYHTVALTEDCSVYTWGWGIHGQLGQGDACDQYLPKALVLPESGDRVCEIAAGYAHTLLLTEKGVVYACGSGVFGQLGLGTTCKHPTLQSISELPTGVISVATKDFHCVAVTGDSKVYQWGASPNLLCDQVRDYRQQGWPRGAPPPTSPLYQQQYLRPALIDTYNVVAKITKVECGSNFSSLLTEDGEVFTWGRNYDGQLGIGNRVDQKCPVMVNRINDRRMAAMTCGADHMVVMDTDRQVWCWGRNDLGQLAVVTSQGSIPQGGQGIYVAMGIYAAVWPTKVPSLNRLTGSGPRQPLPGLRPEDHAGRWHVVMPPLAPYSCDVLFTLLQHLPDQCRCGQWLQQSLDHTLWVTAGSLALHQGALPLALHCHLSALSAFTKEKTEKSATQNKLLLIAEFYLSKLEQVTESNYSVQVQTAQDILCQLGEAWIREKADVATFIDVISKRLSLLAWPFFLLMTRTQSDDDKQEETASAPSLNLPRPLVSALPVPFCLQVTHTVVTLIQQEKIPRAASSSALHVSGAASLEGLQLLPPHRMISADKLWEEIFYNVHKEGSEAQAAITLSGLELEALTAATGQRGVGAERKGVGDVGEAGTGRRGQEGETAVLFSCGHHMPRRTLAEEAVPQLEQALGQMDMSQSAALLRSHYAQKGVVSLACPKCVLNTIKTS